jgi:hypothetical protein
MKRTGRAPYWVTIAASFFTVSRNAAASCGWMGHWLQSIMITASNCLPGLLKTILLPGANE